MAYHDYSGNNQPIHKKYVDVIELRKKDGTLEPQEIIWDDGRRFKITRFEFKQFGSSRAGGGGKHYIVWFSGQQRDMYLEKDKWFIETTRMPQPNDSEWLDQQLGNVVK